MFGYRSQYYKCLYLFGGCMCLRKCSLEQSCLFSFLGGLSLVDLKKQQGTFTQSFT